MFHRHFNNLPFLHLYSCPSRLFSFFLTLFIAGTLNQHSWGKRYPSCTGARQSPVDIDETFTQVRKRYQKLQFEGWDKLTAESSTVHNNGKTGMSASLNVSLFRVWFPWQRLPDHCFPNFVVFFNADLLLEIINYYCTSLFLNIYDWDLDVSAFFLAFSI